MIDVLDRFAAALSPAEPEILAGVADYVRWRAGQEVGAFTPAYGDDVDIRTYLLELRVGGTDRKTIRRRIAALKRFYAWAVEEGLTEDNPFEEFDFDRPLLSRKQIRRRPDVLGVDPPAREFARMRALNRLVERLNRTADLQNALDVTLEALVETLGLQAAWAFLWKEADLAPYFASAGPVPHDFVLSSACGLPPGLEQEERAYLREPPDCHCQSLLRYGQLRRAVNIVECTRLQDSEEAQGDNQGLLFHASVPLFLQGRPAGIINVATNEWQFLGAADLQLLTAAGAQVSITLERARLFARSLELGALEERMRLAREIHDTLAQGLAGIALNLETADALLEAGGDLARPRQAVRQALAQAHAGLDEARRSVLDLRAAPLEGRTLAEALAALADQAGPAVKFISDSHGRPLPAPLEVGLYRIAQEAVANALRHSGAGQVLIELLTGPREVRLRVEDNGRGFDPAQAPKERYGLIGLNERAKLMGGALHLESTLGEGTRVEVVVLLHP